jgi:hypothetical protein
VAQPATQGYAISNSMMTQEVDKGGEIFVVAIRMANSNEEITGGVSIAIQNILADFPEVMEAPMSLPPTRAYDHQIILQENKGPVNVRPYRYAHFQKNEIERQIFEMLMSGLIRPSTSPFSSPILLVKKNGTWCFCIDYRALNAVTVKDRFPIPMVDDMIDELHGSQYFTKLDLRAGYHQIQVHLEDIHNTTFRTHSGHYEYLVMPFGLCNASSTFLAAMNNIFRPHLRKFILVFFFYDIFIYSRENHLLHIRGTFEILANQNFVVKPTKCIFGQTEVDYLGHLITINGVKVDSKKIKVMEAWLVPKTITE